MHLKCFTFYELSKYAVAKSCSANVLSIIFSNSLGAVLIPDGIRLKLYKTQCMLIVGYFEVSSSAITCWYASNKSSFENTLPALTFAKISSVLGNKYSKFLDIHSNQSRNPHRHVCACFSSSEYCTFKITLIHYHLSLNTAHVFSFWK